MKKHSLTGTVVLIFLASTLFSQALLTNDGGIIFVEEQVFMEIQGDVYFEEGSTTPEMDLFGDLYVSGNWYNNSSGPGISVISEGTVSLDGANQFIGGTNSSHFPSLWTEGGPVIKQLFNNVFVHKNFNLFDAYFETNQHILEITNSNPNALSWQNGFVGSSIMGGYIGRAISAGGSYMFPVGDQNLEFTHRPVKIDAYEGSGTVYVRCNGLDPELESSGIGLSSAEGPFDREIVKPFVGKINTEFFHNIYTKMPTSAFESSIYYYSEANAEFDQISNWNLLNSRWEALENHSFSENTSPTFLNLDKHVRFNMTDSNEIIALSSCSKDISTQLITPNNDDLNEYLEIKNALENNGDKIKIYNRWGNLVHEQSNYNNDWNGVATTGNIILESDDKTLPDGVYYFEYWQSESESKPVVNYFHIQK